MIFSTRVKHSSAVGILMILTYLFKTLHVTTSTSTSTSNNRTWHGFETSCYTTLTSAEYVGVFACSRYCNSINARLAEIETPAELSFLQQLMDRETTMTSTGSAQSTTARTTKTASICGSALKRWLTQASGGSVTQTTSSTVASDSPGVLEEGTTWSTRGGSTSSNVWIRSILCGKPRRRDWRPRPTA